MTNDIAACRGEVSSTSLSMNTSPESEDGNNDFYPVFAGPSTSKTQSLPRGGTGRGVSSLVGAMIAEAKEFVPERIEEDRSAPGPGGAGVDEFTRIFSQDDIRMLVDLLKLAVAARCDDMAREAVATLLQNMGESIAGIA